MIFDLLTRALTTPTRITRGLSLVPVALVGLGLPSFASCKKSQADDPPPPPIVVDAAPEKVPPVDITATGLTPIDASAVGDLDSKTPFEQSQIYFGQGEYWKARLMVETTALGEGAPKEHTEHLLKICQAQEDAACVAACGKKLGRKVTLGDGGIAPSASGAEKPDKIEKPGAAPDLARARAAALENRFGEVRKILEPKVLGDSASPEEIRLLKAACAAQKDNMCVALCTAKLK